MCRSWCVGLRRSRTGSRRSPFQDPALARAYTLGWALGVPAGTRHDRTTDAPCIASFIAGGNLFDVTDDQTSSLHPVVSWSAGVVPITLLLVLFWAWTHDAPAVPAPRDGGAFVRHFIHYGLFRGYAGGSPQAERMVAVPVELLEPGDVIVCGNPGAVYGAWSHATIYLGDGEVLSQYLLRGIGIERVEVLAWYDHLRVLRPPVSAATRTAAAMTARTQAGCVFNLMAHPRDPWQLTCSSSVDAAYRAVGVNVTDGRFWVTPESLAVGNGALVVER